MLQNKLLTFYFELKLQVRRMENISATCESLRGRDFNPYYGNVLELAVSREVVGVRPMILSMSVRLLGCACVPFIALVNERAPSWFYMCPFYCGQIIDRCACSGSFCLNPFYDIFMTYLWKGENPRQLTS